MCKPWRETFSSSPHGVVVYGQPESYNTLPKLTARCRQICHQSCVRIRGLPFLVHVDLTRPRQPFSLVNHTRLIPRKRHDTVVYHGSRARKTRMLGTSDRLCVYAITTIIYLQIAYNLLLGTTRFVVMYW